MNRPDPDDAGPKTRLWRLVSKFDELGDQPHATIPNLDYLVDLERGVQAEVDRMVVELRERGYGFANIAEMADATDALPWHRWRTRYRDAVKRLRGEDEEVLSLSELRARRQLIEDMEAAVRIGPRPSVERSLENQSEQTVLAGDLRRGDCIVDGGPRLVVHVEPVDKPGIPPGVRVSYYDGLVYGYRADHVFAFGSESDLRD